MVNFFWLERVMEDFDRSPIHFACGPNLNLASPLSVLLKPTSISGKVLVEHVLSEETRLGLHIFQNFQPYDPVVSWVAIDLMANRAEKTVAVAFHVVYLHSSETRDT
mmetsp:Transcript_5657/g.8658  ORF Transcript_5657/g.8658 Transcript_5657/m.8658 type:complete len:107 (-) Transcript_5657:592-912(-)